jgi:hypothetical protein
VGDFEVAAGASIRAAEAAGKFSPDLRPDAELKESIRRMWEEEANRVQP